MHDGALPMRGSSSGVRKHSVAVPGDTNAPNQ